MNIVDPILFQCRINAEQPAICAPGANLEAMTYAQLEFMLNALTRAVLALGFQRGQVVGVLIGNKILHVALTLALERIGVVTVSCRGRTLPKELGAVAVMTDTAGPITNVDRIIVVDHSWARGNGAPLDPSQFATSSDELCRIILTSGSTGIAKGVAFSHRKLMEKDARFDYLDRWSRSPRLFCDLGLSSSLGFQFVIHMLSRGGMLLLYGDDAASTLQSLNLFEMRSMATSPFGLGEYVKFYESQSGFSCNFDHIVVAGGLLTKELARRAWASLFTRLITLYGATETGPVASADGHLTTQVPGAAGFILPDATVEIVDHDDRPLPRGKEGIVRVHTLQAADCYFGDPETSARHFRDGWFYPGDIGYLRDDTFLVVSGRQETLINVGGDKVNPEIVEQALAGFPAIADCAVFNVANEFGISEIQALIVQRTAFADRELQRYCAEKLQRAFIPVRFIAVEKIPRNDMAKIERSRLPELAGAKSQHRSGTGL